MDTTELLELLRNQPEDLEDWVFVKTRYVCKYTDVGFWGEHEGTWVEEVGEDGTVILRKAASRFQDVTPESTTSVETLKL